MLVQHVPLWSSNPCIDSQRFSQVLSPWVSAPRRTSRMTTSSRWLLSENRGFTGVNPWGLAVHSGSDVLDHGQTRKRFTAVNQSDGILEHEWSDFLCCPFFRVWKQSWILHTMIRLGVTLAPAPCRSCSACWHHWTKTLLPKMRRQGMPGMPET